MQICHEVFKPKNASDRYSSQLFCSLTMHKNMEKTAVKLRTFKSTHDLQLFASLIAVNHHFKKNKKSDWKHVAAK